MLGVQEVLGVLASREVHPVQELPVAQEVLGTLEVHPVQEQGLAVLQLHSVSAAKGMKRNELYR